jgi:hypothetical protein
MNRFKYIALSAAVAALTASSYALPTLTLSSGASSVTVTDNGVGDSNPLLGDVTFIGSVGAWYLNVSTGTSNSPLGPNINPTLDLNSIDYSSAGASALTITWSDSFAGDPTGDMNASIGGTLSGATLLFTGSQNATPVTTLGTYSGGSGGVFGGATLQNPGLANPGDPYTLTETIVLTPTGDLGSSNSFNSTLYVTTPDNGTTALLIGLGLAGIGLGVIAQRRKLAKA